MGNYETPKLEKLLGRGSQIQKVFLHNSSRQKVHIHYGPEEKWISFPFGAMNHGGAGAGGNNLLINRSLKLLSTF